MKKINAWFGLNTVRKKVLLLSKLAGGIIVFFYVFTSELPTNRSIAFVIWFGLLVAVIIGVDAMLGRFISKPLDEINRTARQMAKLDFSAHCNIHAEDEFGELSQNLNTMFSNLGEALEKLEAANKQLEKEATKQHLLLTQRKELVDSLSHEMKTPLGLIRAYVEGLKEETNENIQSEEGILKRQTRSIQTEGHFGDIKENENFRRFHYRSKEKVYKEFMLYAIGRNIMKYHRFLHHEIEKYEGKKEQKTA